MTTLGELASVLRSKNAGPFQITVDVMFDDPAAYNRVLHSGVLTPERIAPLYGVTPEVVQIIPFPAVRAIKVTFDRSGPSSGAPGDRDVYGAQQHAPVMQLEIP